MPDCSPDIVLDKFVLRDKIIFGSMQLWEPNEIKYFENLSYSQLYELIDNNLIELDECQNDSPTVNEFYKFMQLHINATAHGYVVSPGRDDTRVSLEGIALASEFVDKSALSDFIELCKHADELQTQGDLYAWWD
jgi:hypothetical protein